MLKEISYGVKFLVKLLESKLDKIEVEKLSSCLTSVLQTKYMGHWKPSHPNHGNAFRSIHTSSEKLDPVIRAAADAAEIPEEKIMSAFPYVLTLWIDPFEVSYRIGAQGSICHNVIEQSDPEPTPSIAVCTPPPSPARVMQAKTPLLPLPLTRRPSEAGFSPQASPPMARSMSRSMSRDLMGLGSPQPMRRASALALDGPMLARSPSRADVYIHYEDLAPIPQSPRRSSVLDLGAAPYPMVLSH